MMDPFTGLNRGQKTAGINGLEDHEPDAWAKEQAAICLCNMGCGASTENGGVANPFNKGDECFHTADSHGTASDDNRTLYREKGVVTGPSEYPECVMVQFQNNKDPCPVPTA